MDAYSRLYHLKVLGLDPHASRTDIRRAYRSLSKKYHPDVNQDPQAIERFISVKKAYDYLVKDGPATSFHETPSPDPREQWKAEVRAQARRKAAAEAAYRQKMKRRVRRVLTPLVWVISAFNILLVVDYMLPRESYQPDMYRIHQYADRDVLFTNRYRIELDEDAFDNNLQISRLEIMITPILQNYVNVKLNMNGNDVVLDPEAGVYALFGYLIPIIFLVSLIYFRGKFGLENLLALTFFLFILAIIQLVLIVKYGG